MTPAQVLATAQRRASRESLELAMLQQIRAAKLDGGMVREHEFHPTRRWRFDFCWPDRKAALEVDGATFTGGRHTSGTGYDSDCHKLAEATLLGWRVIRATAAQVKAGIALQWVERLVRP